MPSRNIFYWPSNSSETFLYGIPQPSRERSWEKKKKRSDDRPRLKKAKRRSGEKTVLHYIFSWPCFAVFLLCSEEIPPHVQVYEKTLSLATSRFTQTSCIWISDFAFFGKERWRGGGERWIVFFSFFRWFHTIGYLMVLHFGFSLLMLLELPSKGHSLSLLDLKWVFVTNGRFLDKIAWRGQKRLEPSGSSPPACSSSSFLPRPSITRQYPGESWFMNRALSCSRLLMGQRDRFYRLKMWSHFSVHLCRFEKLFMTKEKYLRTLQASPFIEQSSINLRHRY